MNIIELDPFDPIGEPTIDRMIKSVIEIQGTELKKELILSILRRLQNIRSQFMFDVVTETKEGLHPEIISTYEDYVTQRINFVIVDSAFAGET